MGILTDKNARDASQRTMHLSSLKKSDNPQTFSQNPLLPYIPEISAVEEPLESHVEGSKDNLITSTPDLSLPLQATSQYPLPNTARTSSSTSWVGSLQSGQATSATDYSIIYNIQSSQKSEGDTEPDEPQQTIEPSPILDYVGNSGGLLTVLQPLLDTANFLHQAVTTSVSHPEYHGDALHLPSTENPGQLSFLQSEDDKPSTSDSLYDRPSNRVSTEHLQDNSDVSTGIEYQSSESPQPTFDALFQSAGHNHGSTGGIHSSTSAHENKFNDQSIAEVTSEHVSLSQSSSNAEAGLTASLSQERIPSGPRCCVSSAVQTQTSVHPINGEFTMEDGRKSQDLSKKGVGVLLGSVSGASVLFFSIFFFHRRCYKLFQRRRKGTILVPHVPENQPRDSDTNLVAKPPEHREISYFSADS